MLVRQVGRWSHFYSYHFNLIPKYPVKSILKNYTTIANDELPYTKIHTPVMLSEVLTHLAPEPGKIYCDLTFGDGGYTKAILDSCDCKVVAVDQDPTAYEKALQLAATPDYKGRLFPLLSKFGQIDSAVKKNFDWSFPCFDGMVMDIGVSSGQIETASRGFSYKLDGPLDMRMCSRGKDAPSSSSEEFTFEDEARLMRKSISAYELVNFYSREQIADIIYKYGGDRLSRKIAAAIVDARQKAPIETTGELAAIVQKTCPQPRWQRGDDDMLRNSAARTFQALRIYINDELAELESALRSSEYLLRPQGRLVVVSFHSLEDRIAKNFLYHCAGKRSTQEAETNQFSLKRAANREFRKATRNNYDADVLLKQPSGQVLHKHSVVPSFELKSKSVVQASKEETAVNSRSRSAKLRVGQRTMAEPLSPFGPLDL
ncbi:MraW methylase family-domain-containing protein [Phycomyces blakesleeanus]|uniref:MraW methylase family-domain-containing protein n=1 Tax=Phycomyces blakesleeanus TaxID=4837 RepID=A0ABR3BB15_PHYBL